MSWLRGACTSCERAPASERGACTSWLRGACSSCDRAPASERGACTSWLLAVWVSIAFADATSGGQEVCPIPAEAERATTVVTPNTVASSFLIFLLPSFLLRLGLATKQVDQILSLCRQGGKDRVVPVPVKRVGPQADGLQGVAADLEAGGIAGRVEPRPHAEARGGRRGRDQVHDDRVAEEGLASPVLADEGEQAVFDLVPLARAGREMAHRDGQAEAVRQLLQLDLPQPQAGAVAAAGVGRDQQPPSVGIGPAPHGLPPVTNARDGKRRRVVVDADTDPAGVGAQIVDPVGNGAPQLRLHEVVDPHRPGLPVGTPFAAGILELPHELLLLGIDGDRRLALAQGRLDAGGDV